MKPTLARRGLLAALLATPALQTAAQAPPAWRARQFHNQPAESHLQRHLADLWSTVHEQTGGRLLVTVHPQNAGIPGSDPAALDMLVSGELEFFCLMGGLLGRIVPAAEIQGMPFAFANHDQVHRANDGPLGAYIGRECTVHGLHRFPKGLLENGFRHIGMTARPIRTADDLAGVRMRVPDGPVFRDLFTALGAVPVTVNINELYAALRDHTVDGQENPLVVTEFNRLYDVTRYMSLTSHMWSGFNMLANLAYWTRLPQDVQDVIDRTVTATAIQQRRDTDALNHELETRLTTRGVIFNTADTATFRTKLAGGFYPRWKSQLGAEAWSLLEDEVGHLG